MRNKATIIDATDSKNSNGNNIVFLLECGDSERNFELKTFKVEKI